MERLLGVLVALLVGLIAGQEADNKQLQEVAALGLQSCIDGFVVHRDKIIRTQDSQEMGAKYLTEFDVESRIECMRACCETPHCDVFIFEEKKPGSCYLFHCGPPHDFKCKFTSHVNYSSAVLTDYNLQNAVALEEEIRRNQQEHELKSLRKSEMPAKEYNYFTNPPATTSSTPAPTPSTTTTTVAPVKAAACSRNQFECRSGDDCIAIYNVCDGIPQCADGSDEAAELGCPVDRTTQAPALPPAPGIILATPKPYLPLLPDVLRYQQMIQQQQQAQQRVQQQQQQMQKYPMMYPDGQIGEPGKGWPLPNSPNLPNQVPEMGYPGREYGSPVQPQLQPQQQQQPPGEEAQIQRAGMASQPEQQQQQQQLPVNYKLPPPAPGYQWNGYPGPIYEPSGNKFAASAAALDVMHAIPPAYEQEQMPRIFNHKGPGIRLDDLEAANGVYGQDPNRVYAPYYPHMMHHAKPTWQEGNPMQQIQVPVPTPAPPHEQANLEAQVTRTTSTSAPPCDPADKPDDDTAAVKSNKKKASVEAAQKASGSSVTKAKSDVVPPAPSEQHDNKPMPASVVKADIHKVHELEVRMPDAHLQQHKGLAIAEHVRRHGPSIDELEMTRPKGAVISLALGLTVTAIMAVLIACRMRVVKRRGRGRGHDSYAQDADYLVNGMYL